MHAFNNRCKHPILPPLLFNTCPIEERLKKKNPTRVTDCKKKITVQNSSTALERLLTLDAVVRIIRRAYGILRVGYGGLPVVGHRCQLHLDASVHRTSLAILTPTQTTPCLVCQRSTFEKTGRRRGGVGH